MLLPITRLFESYVRTTSPENLVLMLAYSLAAVLTRLLSEGEERMYQGAADRANDDKRGVRGQRMETN